MEMDVMFISVSVPSGRFNIDYEVREFEDARDYIRDELLMGLAALKISLERRLSKYSVEVTYGED
jgi:hypothetical protein